MLKTVVCYLIRDDEVLLGYKKRGFGEGKYTGIGGKIESGEDSREAIIRELAEEIAVTVAPDDLQDRGIIRFRFPGNPEWDLSMAVFTTESWEGTPSESAEVRPLWFGFDELPVDRMWDDARLWMPHILNGSKIDATVFYDDSNDSVDHFKGEI